MEIPVLIPAIAALSNLALAALVFSKRPLALVNQLFALAALSAAGWAATNALFQQTDSISVATLTAQASSASAILMSAAFLRFSWEYPQRTRVKRRWVYALWLLAAGLCLLSFWPGAVDRTVDLSGAPRIITGPGFPLVALFLFAATATAFAVIARQLRTLKDSLREQALYVVTGAGATALFGTVFNLALPLFGDYRLVWLGPSCSVFFVGGTVYSIVAHHLFDIRLIIKRTAVYSLLLALISAAYSGAEYLLTELLNRVTQGTTSPFAAHIAGAILVSLWINPTRKWLERKIHHLLYRRPHRRKRAHHTRRASQV